MSALVRLSAKLAGDPEVNGLDSLQGELLANPHAVVCAIVWLVPTKITEDVEGGERVPTVQVKRIEPIGVVDKVPAEVVKLALDLQEKRTGKRPLPFGITEVIEGGYVEPDEG